MLAALLAVPGCGDDEGSGPGGNTGGSGGGAGGTGGEGTSLPQAICNAGTQWTPGTPVFVERTMEWGLEGVLGIRLSTVDFDGDGYPDLTARLNGGTPDDFAPGGERRSWLLRNDGQGRFEDVTQSSGIRATRFGTDPNVGRPGEVWAFADVDNDGDLDVYTGLWTTPDTDSEERSEILLNNGDGTFSLGPEASDVRLGNNQGYDVPGGASFVDYNRDGLIDLWVGQGTIDGSPAQDRLLYGDGTGTMLNVTSTAGLTTKSWGTINNLNLALSHSNAWGTAACDLDGDGNSELLASSYGRAPNHLWHASGPDGGFVFTNHSIDSGYAFDHRVDWTDNESAMCWCTLNPGDEDCAGVPEPQYIICQDPADAFRWNHAFDREPFRLGGNSGSTICGDVDNDGNIDLLTTEIVHWDVGSSSDPSELLFNDGQSPPRFERPGNETTGLTREHTELAWNDGDMTGALFDFDNDGWTDVYIGNSDYPGAYGLLFHQESPRQFVPVPTSEGIDHNRSHGIAVADFDRDGDLDVVVGHSIARCDANATHNCYETQQVRFFENVMGDASNFIQLSLEGAPGTNRSAIGARVTVTAGGITQTQQIGGGHGHYGIQHDLTLHVGLADACEAEVTVQWPDAALTEESFTLPAGYRFIVRQGQPPEAVLAPDSNLED